MSEDLNAVEEVVETPEAATEEEIAAVVPEKKAASRKKNFKLNRKLRLTHQLSWKKLLKL